MHRNLRRVVVLSIALPSTWLTACSSSPATLEGETGFGAASSAPREATDPILVSVWLVDGWPRPDGFAFGIDPVATDLGGLEPVSSTFRAEGLPANTYLLTADGLAGMERDMNTGDHMRVVTAPRLLVEPGQEAAITIGSADEPTPAFHLALRAAPAAGGTELSWHCETADRGEARTAADADPYAIPTGQASATLLGTRPGGGWRLLVVAAGVGSPNAPMP
ncbi:MAG: hypothetical protein KDA22_12600 [Phycisphaerales bacterium]|nr:hypothetical protein [Phycisphaerales bacterium]